MKLAKQKLGSTGTVRSSLEKYCEPESIVKPE